MSKNDVDLIFINFLKFLKIKVSNKSGAINYHEITKSDVFGLSVQEISILDKLNSYLSNKWDKILLSSINWFLIYYYLQ